MQVRFAVQLQHFPLSPNLAAANPGVSVDFVHLSRELQEIFSDTHRIGIPQHEEARP